MYKVKVTPKTRNGAEAPYLLTEVEEKKGANQNVFGDAISQVRSQTRLSDFSGTYYRCEII